MVMLLEVIAEQQLQELYWNFKYRSSYYCVKINSNQLENASGGLITYTVKIQVT
jgi:hypothetical protein